MRKGVEPGVRGLAKEVNGKIVELVELKYCSIFRFSPLKGFG